MTTTTTDRVEQILADRFGDRIYDVHDGRVWVSGANENCRGVARRIIRDLESHGIACGIVRDEQGGVAFGFVDEDLSCHPEDDNLPGHHAVVSADLTERDGGFIPAKPDFDEFEEFIGEKPDLGEFGSNRDPDPPADDGLAALLALAVAVILAFASGFAVGWFL